MGDETVPGSHGPGIESSPGSKVKKAGLNEGTVIDNNITGGYMINGTVFAFYHGHR